MQPNQVIRDALALWDEGLIPPGCMLWRLVEFTRWVATGGCKIRDVHGDIISLKMNLVQRLILARMISQAMVGQPIRIIVLKARKTGVSTFIQAVFVRICQTCTHQIARTIAHRTEDTKDIFDIARRVVAQGDEEEDEPKRTELDFGSQSKYSCATGGARGVGAGGTPNMLHLSEFGLWPHVMGHDVATSTEYTITSSVPLVPESIIVYESTARGPNAMWDRYCDGRDGKTKYGAIFVPWYYDERNSVLAPPGFTRDKDERLVCRRASRDGIELSDGNLEWRRMKMADLKSVHIFKQEFPSTPEEAIETAKGLVLPSLRDWVVPKLPFDYGLVDPSGRVGGWDHGYNDPAALISGVVWDGVLWILSVERGSGLLSGDMVRDWTIMPGHRYYCDPSALGHRKELAAACKLAGIPAQFVASPTARATTKVDIAEFEWHRLRQFIADGRLRVHKDAAEQLLIEAESFFFHATNGRVDKVRSEATGHFDVLDALRYTVNGVLAGESTRVPPRTERPRSRRSQMIG